MMTNDTAARYTVDRNARLHRPDGTFATRAEVEAVERCAYALRIELADAFAAMQAQVETNARRIELADAFAAMQAQVETNARRAVRRFVAPETKPGRPVLPRWKAEVEHNRQVSLWGWD